MLSTKNRLRKKKEFSFIYKKGQSYHNKYLTLYVYKTKFNFSKIGFSVNNKVGNSVVRHKIKRRLTEILRVYIKSLPTNNYIFVAKTGCENLDFYGLKEQVNNIIEKMKDEK